MTKTKSVTRAAIYTRVSRDFSGKHRAVERQEEDCRIMCKINGWEIVRVYSDNSISAYSGKERPQYDRMIRDFKRGRFDVIVAYKMDRLTRSIEGFVQMIKELTRQKLRICTCDLGDIDLSESGSEFTAHLMVNLAQFESRRKSERSKRANLQRAKAGYIKRGTRSFGFDANLHIIEDEAACIRKMYEAYAAGASMSSIARNIAGIEHTLDLPHYDAPSLIFARERWNKLTEEEKANLTARQVQMLPRELFAQIPPEQLKRFTKDDRKEIMKAQSKPEKKFDLAVTQQILKNPKYAGYVCYVPTIDGKCQPTNSHWTDFIVRDATGEPVKAAWPAIVPPDLWWQVQARREKNKYKADGTRIDRNGSKIRHIGSWYYLCYVCGQPVKAGDQCYECRGHVSRTRTHIDKYVLTSAILRLMMPESFDLTDHSTDAEVEQLKTDISDARGRLRSVRKEHELWLAGEGGTVDKEMYTNVSARLTERISSLETRLQTLAAPAVSLLADVLDSNNPAKAFMRIHEVGQVQHILKQMMDVTLYKHLEGKRYNADTLLADVGITWKLLPDPQHINMSDDDRRAYATRLLETTMNRDSLPQFTEEEMEDIAPWARDLYEAPDFILDAAQKAVEMMTITRVNELMMPGGRNDEYPTFAMDVATDPVTGELSAAGGVTAVETDSKTTLSELLESITKTAPKAKN